MRLDDGIRRHGFRDWYSRELTQAHLRLLLLLFSAIGLFATLELLGRQAPLGQHLLNTVLLLVCLGVGMWSLRRYLFLMMRAEGIARQAVCPNCQAYGRLKLSEEAADGDGPVTVACRKCAHPWQISDVGTD
jgi:Zn ribbon nucleic-acid-binding protein